MVAICFGPNVLQDWRFQDLEIRMFGMFRVAIPGACGMICLTQCLALLMK